jgi:hypothetical protein
MQPCDGAWLLRKSEVVAMTYNDNETLSGKDAVTGEASGTPGLSYKFQRLRERIRAAVAAGELQGKLPGERALARRFNVNAKTLSKALTDLAAEGLLDRSIGRGTYVKGSAPAASIGGGRWLVFATPASADTTLVRRLRVANPELTVHTGENWDLRPSFLGSFTAAVSLNPAVPDAVLRGLVVRGMTVVTVDYQPKVFSMHAVLDDIVASATTLARTLLAEGHRSFLAVEDRAAANAIATALRQAASRLAPEAVIDCIDATDLAGVAQSVPAGTTVVCGSPTIATTARAALALRTDVSVWAVGCASGAPTVGGCFGDESHKADAIVATLNDPPARPSTVWLAGQFTQGPMAMVTPDSGRLSDALHGRVALAS